MGKAWIESTKNSYPSHTHKNMPRKRIIETDSEWVHEKSNTIMAKHIYIEEEKEENDVVVQTYTESVQAE